MGERVENLAGSLADKEADEDEEEAEAVGGYGDAAPMLADVPHDNPEVHEEAAEASEGDGHAEESAALVNEGKKQEAQGGENNDGAVGDRRALAAAPAEPYKG